MSRPTDWNEYYAHPAPAAHITRRITTRLLLSLVGQYGGAPRSICELGGANSCFVDALRTAYPESDYAVIDNNPLGLQLLGKRAGATQRLSLHNHDIRDLPEDLLKADVVFSVGLVEHFTADETARIIAKHFSLLRPGGLVIITFPTPTWLYRATRGVAELVGAWKFPDERPLEFPEVIKAIEGHGAVLRTLINWPIVLTQGVVVARSPC